MGNTHCFFSTTMVARTCISVTLLHIACLVYILAHLLVLLKTFISFSPPEATCHVCPYTYGMHRGAQIIFDDA